MWKTIVIFSLINTIQGLQIEEFYIENRPYIGNDVNIICNYNLQNDKLFSFKMYFNNTEIYNYSPPNDPITTVHNITNLYINSDLSTQNSILLSSVSIYNKGIYTCEVTTVAPFFLTDKETLYLSVLPARSIKSTSKKPSIILIPSILTQNLTPSTPSLNQNLTTTILSPINISKITSNYIFFVCILLFIMYILLIHIIIFLLFCKFKKTNYNDNTYINFEQIDNFEV